MSARVEASEEVIVRLALTAQALREMAYMEVVGLSGFQALQRVVSRTPTRHPRRPPPPVLEVVQAMRTACALYVKPVMCLQRSAVVTRMLRQHGVPAQLVVGCHLPPLQAHAWVEVAGEVVSDHLDGLEYFQVLDRW